MQHVMLDLETLGTTADAVILSIGAVKFDLASHKIDDKAGFYASISVESNLAKGRRVDEDTLIWWFKQSPAAQRVFHEEKSDLGTALDDLSAWFESEDLTVWSNGASFDIPMLEHAYRQHDWLPPWKFWNSRCYRTFKGLPGMGKVAKSEQGVAHHALTDALNQALHLQAMYQVLTGKEKV